MIATLPRGFAADPEVGDREGVLSADAVALVLVLLRAFGGVGQLFVQLGQRLALAALHVGESAVMLGADRILFARLLLDTRGDAGLFRESLRHLHSRFGQRLAPLPDVERRVLAGTGQRLLERVDGRPMVGGDALAVALVFGNQRLESFLCGRRGLKAPLEASSSSRVPVWTSARSR